MTNKTEEYKNIGLWIFMLGMLVVLMRTAWLCDDAYITFRTVDNFISGYGLRWNIAERVQSYTHPLWMLLISAFYYFTGEPYYSAIYISIYFSLGVLWLLWRRIAADYLLAIIGALVLFASKAFIDYSTSGLENPLTNLLLVIFLAMYLKPDKKWGRREIFYLALVACMGMLNRMDTALLFLPPLAYRLYVYKRAEGYAIAALAFVPFAAWEVFSIIYYGVPFPNTAYAKLNTGIEGGRLMVKGFGYLLDSLRVDPITLSVISLAIALAVYRRVRSEMIVALGMVLYMIYIVKIGGDFMSGRFLTGPLVCAVALIVSRPLPGGRRGLITVIVCVLMLGSMTKYPPVLSGADYGLDRGEIASRSNFFYWEQSIFLKDGIVDERGYYFQTAGMLRANKSKGYKMINNALCGFGLYLQSHMARLLVGPSAGFVGYCAGSGLYVLDSFALADPLLVRLPAEVQSDFRIGHIGRKIPKGYPESILQNNNSIEDAGIARLYDAVRLVTRSDKLFTLDRFRAIWQLNTDVFALPESASEYQGSDIEIGKPVF